MGSERVAWLNDDMVLYHGCSDRSLYPGNENGIVVTGGPHNISHTAGARRPDFGPGFYTTTWLHQAKCWANERVRKLQVRDPSVKAVVLTMRIERNSFANLQSLIFLNTRDSFFPFVAYCRGGGTPHAGHAVIALTLACGQAKIVPDFDKGEAGHSVTYDQWVCHHEWEKRGKVRDNPDAVWHGRMIA